MNSVEIMNQNLGHIECTVCGSGNNRLIVRLFEDDSFTVTRHSRCYSDEVEEFVDGIFLREYMERNSFLVSTRYARREVAAFKRLLRKGEYCWRNYGTSDRNSDWDSELVDEHILDLTYAAPVVTGTHTLTWDPTLLSEELPF